MMLRGPASVSSAVTMATRQLAGFPASTQVPGADTTPVPRLISRQYTPRSWSRRPAPLPPARPGMWGSDYEPDFGHTSRPAFSASHLDDYTKYSLNPQTLKTVADFGINPSQETYSQSCNFLATEASIRLAHMIEEMRQLPPEQLEESHIREVYEWYVRSFEDFAAVCHGRHNDIPFNAATTSLVRKVLRRHAGVVMTTALGIRELRQSGVLRDDIGMNEFLNRFFMSRIGIRFLFNQHLVVFRDFTGDHSTTERHLYEDDTWVGAIDRGCVVADVVQDAAREARLLCEEKYFDSPEINVIVPENCQEHHCITCVPSHLYHIMFELLKNSCRAVTEHHESCMTTGTLPPIEVTVVVGEQDVGIRISDKGGGIPQSKLNDIFSYHYSTAETPSLFIDGRESLADMNHAPLAGFGYGLPVSRLYARYFGGDLTISSLEKYGTDAYVYLRANPLEAIEVLPSASSPELRYTGGLHKRTVEPWQRKRKRSSSRTLSAAA